MQKKRIALLGSTGSIGSQALDVIRSHSSLFAVEVLTAQTRCDLLIDQAREFLPNAVVIGEDCYYEKVREALHPLPVKVFAGQASIAQIVESEEIDLVLNALVGFAGLEPTLRAIRSGKDIALANKETLVVAGELVMKEAASKGVRILPVDSEHSAIFQCLEGEDPSSVEKLILTASGGPFRGKKIEHLREATKEAALNHPRWKMGNKVTIDSASLMNKGLEVIEAHWLFGLDSRKIEVVIHPQSVIHSIVQFIDGSMKAQMGLPDMRLPIQYALGYPGRLASGFPRFSFRDSPGLTFEVPDHQVFRNLGLAYEALEQNGNMPCILNAANEIAVQAFLEDRITFLGMPELVEKCMHSVTFVAHPGYEDYIASDSEARIRAREFIKSNPTG
ncbi:MAG TPA: 1-deoxy-D-xylulose-5-phosphate reductoisomerase [Bacteroidales bacterium]|nr:1-deoxy-D-xylulose-5-phosphate reductoisomerase [Bacteroidales bacterium]